MLDQLYDLIGRLLRIIECYLIRHFALQMIFVDLNVKTNHFILKQTILSNSIMIEIPIENKFLLSKE